MVMLPHWKTKTYRAWVNMKQRCCNPKNPQFHDYGGRGIYIYGPWLEYKAFLEDMGEVPEGMTLERVDNHKGYGPDNCIWAPRSVQARNTRQTRILTFKGKTQCMKDWANDYGLTREQLRDRLNKLGWPLEKALTTPIRPLKFN